MDAKEQAPRHSAGTTSEAALRGLPRGPNYGLLAAMARSWVLGFAWIVGCGSGVGVEPQRPPVEVSTTSASPSASVTAPAVSSAVVPTPPRLPPARERYAAVVARALERGFVVDAEEWVGDEAAVVTFVCPRNATCEEGAVPAFALLSPTQTDVHEATSSGGHELKKNGSSGHRLELRGQGETVIALEFPMMGFRTGQQVMEYDRDARAWKELEPGGSSRPSCIECRVDGERIEGRPVFRDTVASLIVDGNGPYFPNSADGWVFEVWDGAKFSRTYPALRDLYARKLVDARRRVPKLNRKATCPIEAIRLAVEIYTLEVASGGDRARALKEVDGIVGGRSTKHCADGYPKEGMYTPFATPWPELRAELETFGASFHDAFATEPP